MDVSNKAQLVAYLTACRDQATFDNDGNGEANFNWLLNDLNGMSDGAFNIRATFLDGSEQAARAAAAQPPAPETPPETPPPATTADGTPQVPIDSEAVPAAELAPSVTENPPAPKTPPETPPTVTTDVEHEAAQDKRIADLEKKLGG